MQAKQIQDIICFVEMPGTYRGILIKYFSVSFNTYCISEERNVFFGFIK